MVLIVDDRLITRANCHLNSYGYLDAMSRISETSIASHTRMSLPNAPSLVSCPLSPHTPSDISRKIRHTTSRSPEPKKPRLQPIVAPSFG